MNSNAHRRLFLVPFAAASLAFAALTGCNDSPTTALVENLYPTGADGGTDAETMTVFKVWWVTTLFARPLGPGMTSETERVVPGSDFAYALLAPGWSPDDGSAPRRLIAIKSASKLSVATHDLLQIVMSDDQFVGNCAAGKPLSAADARLIVERLFPGAFAALVYDPATCTSVPANLDAGSPDGGGNSGSDAAPDSSTD
jgi:hypothetical protein